jgi:hypothetical protein
VNLEVPRPTGGARGELKQSESRRFDEISLPRLPDAA